MELQSKHPNRLMTLARMARRLGVTQAWLRSEAKAGRVPHLPAAGRMLFSPDATEAVLSARASGQPAPSGTEVSCNG